VRCSVSNQSDARCDHQAENLTPSANRQFPLFDDQNGKTDSRPEKLMGALDGINRRYGRWVLRLADEGVEKTWQMRRGNLSPGYTTSWCGLPVVCAK